jgi:hypothetical protein
VICNPKTHDSFHTLTVCLSEVNFNIVRHIDMGLLNGILHSASPDETLYEFLLSLVGLHGSRHVCFILFGLITLIFGRILGSSSLRTFAVLLLLPVALLGTPLSKPLSCLNYRSEA